MSGYPSGGERRRRGTGVALAVACLAGGLVAADLGIMTTALPTVGRGLGFSGEGLPWVLTAYALAFAGFLPLGGRTADLLGYRRAFLLGLLLFATGALAGGASMQPWMLVAARIVQGLGAAVISPVTLALVTGLFPEGRRRERAVGVLVAMAGIGYTGGLVLGGVVIHLLDWRWVLLLQVPLAFTALLLTPVAVSDGREPGRRQRLDLAGAITVTLGLAALIYALSEAGVNGWLSRPTLGFGGAGVLLLAGFILIERRAAAPLVPLSIFSVGSVAMANLAIMLKSTVGVADVYVPTRYLQDVLGYSPLASGLSFVPSALAAVAAGYLAGRLIHRLGGVRRAALLGLGTLIAGLAVQIGGMLSNGGLGFILVGTVLDALGYVLSDVALIIAATAGLGADNRGAGTGLLRTSSQLGAAWGLGVIASVVALAVGTAGGEGDGAAALEVGLSAGLAVGVGFVGLTMLVVLVGLRHQTGISGASVAQRSPPQSPAVPRRHLAT